MGFTKKQFPSRRLQGLGKLINGLSLCVYRVRNGWHTLVILTLYNCTVQASAALYRPVIYIWLYFQVICPQNGSATLKGVHTSKEFCSFQGGRYMNSGRLHSRNRDGLTPSLSMLSDPRPSWRRTWLAESSCDIWIGAAGEKTRGMNCKASRDGAPNETQNISHFGGRPL